MQPKYFVILVILLALVLGTVGVAAQAPNRHTPQVDGCIPGETYDPACDVNHDGVVDINDIQLTAGHWNQAGTYASGSWDLTGNAGTNPTTNFLGTTDFVSLTLKVNNIAALRVVPAADTYFGFSPNVIGGHDGNNAFPDIVGATIGGGGSSTSACGSSGDIPCINQVNASFGTVGGGLGNSASSDYATIGGGRSNTASQMGATVGGGYQNTTGLYATVGGGGYNSAGGYNATVAGGRNNTASSAFSTIGGGNVNDVSGAYSTIGGGFLNSAIGDTVTVSGGHSNTADGSYTTVGGGYGNSTGHQLSTVGGGYQNSANSNYATVAGGDGNSATGDYATIGGGQQNTAVYYGTVSGGHSNTASGVSAAVGGGQNNTAGLQFSTVGGGNANSANGAYATVGGGSTNTANGEYATVGGGQNNSASGNFSLAAGRRAKANHAGAFVWADSTESDYASTAPNQFIIRAGGGVGIGTNTPRSALQVVGNYVQFPTITGAPPDIDCDEAGEGGRMVVRIDGPPDLYVCRGVGGWVSK